MKKLVALVTVMFALSPGTPLASDARYTARLTRDITDLAGNALNRNHTWTFTTNAAPDLTPPT